MYEAQSNFIKINAERNEIIQIENQEKAAAERVRDEKEQLEISKIPDSTPDWKKKQLAEDRDKKRKVEQERDLKKKELQAKLDQAKEAQVKKVSLPS